MLWYTYLSGFLKSVRLIKLLTFDFSREGRWLTFNVENLTPYMIIFLNNRYIKVCEKDLHLISRRKERVTLQPVAACQQRTVTPPGHLVLSHFGTCMCSNVETNLSWTCLVSGLLNFKDPSVLLFCISTSKVEPIMIYITDRDLKVKNGKMTNLSLQQRRRGSIFNVGIWPRYIVVLYIPWLKS